MTPSMLGLGGRKNQMIREVVLLSLLVGATTAHAATLKPACDNARALWAYEKVDVRQVIDGTDGRQPCFFRRLPRKRFPARGNKCGVSGSAIFRIRSGTIPR